jgi:hypothetical protein
MVATEALGQKTIIDENYMMKKSMSTNSSEDTFELITAKDTITSDKHYVQNQLMRLLRSDPITIEEKGVMINHMHHKDLRAVLQ